MQEAFLRYMKDEKPIANKEHEKAWLIRTTIHICMDILKEQLAAADRAAGGIHAGGVERGLSAVSDQG